MLNKNKKAQIGSTLTWLIATLIIVFILFVFVIISTGLGASKKIIDYRLGLTSTAIHLNNDIFLTKSVITYFQLKKDSIEQKALNLNLQKLEEEGNFEGSLDSRKAEIQWRLYS